MDPSNLDITLADEFHGGTLTIVHAAATLPDSFLVTNDSPNNTTDANGNATTINGSLNGPGGMTFADSSGTHSTITLTNTGNTYAGTTTINPNGSLLLSGGGSIAASSGVVENGIFDISGIVGGAFITSLSGSGAVHLGGQSLTLTAAADTFNGVISGGGSPTTAGASITTLAGTGTVNLGAQTLTLTWSSVVANNETFSGVISGIGGLTIATYGAEFLAGTNTYTGPTTINPAGILFLSGTGSIAASSGVTDDGIFDISATTGGASIITLSGNGAVNHGTQTLTLTAAADTFSGAINGTGGLNLTGGSETLTGTSTYSGGTSVSNATLAISCDAALGNPAGGLSLTNATLSALGNLTSGRAITLIGSDTFGLNGNTVMLSGVINGTGGLTASGGGILSLSGTNTYSGGTTIDGATLQINADANLGSATGALTLNNGTLFAAARFNSARNVALAGSNTINTNSYPVGLSGTVSGTGGLTTSGGGSLTLSGSNTL